VVSDSANFSLISTGSGVAERLQTLTCSPIQGMLNFHTTRGRDNVAHLLIFDR
jgi:hypothetical protein